MALFKIITLCWKCVTYASYCEGATECYMYMVMEM